MATRLAVRSFRASVKNAAPLGRRSLSSIEPAYTASATSTGSRASGTGKVGQLSVKWGMPKEMGGKGAEGEYNPEQMFSLGYSSCFLSALGASHKNLFKDKKPLPSSTNVKVKTSIGKPVGGEGFQIAVEIELLYDSVKDVLSKQEAQELLKAAHEMCPYSKATRNNIEQHVRLAE